MQTPFENHGILCPGCVPAGQAIRKLRQALVLAMTMGFLALSGCQPMIVKPAHPSTAYRDFSSHMSEDKRATITRVAIAPGDTEIEFVASGSQYGKTGDEVSEGIAAGVDAALSPDGSGEGAIVYILMLPIILPVAATVGGVAGAVEAEQRENKKEAADALIASANGQVANVLLAEEIQKHLSELDGVSGEILRAPAVDTTLAEIDADALLNIRILEVSAEVNENSRLGVSVEVELLRLPGGEPLYHEVYGSYDTRSMRSWTANNGEAWREHLRLAKIRIGERIVQNLFALLEVRHVLKPVATESYADFKQAKLNSLTPELAWEFTLLGDDTHLAAPPEIDENDITWDLQILADGQQLYRRTSLAAQRHQVEGPLGSCQTLTWSVRPRYRLRQGERVGEWMTVAAAERGDTVSPRADFHLIRTPCSKKKTS